MSQDLAGINASPISRARLPQRGFNSWNSIHYQMRCGSLNGSGHMDINWQTSFQSGSGKLPQAGRDLGWRRFAARRCPEQLTEAHRGDFVCANEKWAEVELTRRSSTSTKKRKAHVELQAKGGLRAAKSSQTRGRPEYDFQRILRLIPCP